MKFDAIRKKEYYQLLEELVATHFPGLTWKWEKGAKSSYMTIATVISDHLKEDEDYEYVYEETREYIEATFKEWLSWEASAIYNLVGYLNKKDRIYMFLGKKAAKSTSTHEVFEGLY